MVCWLSLYTVNLVAVVRLLDATVQLFPSQRLCRLLSASLASVYTTPTMIVVHVQDLVSLFRKGLTGGDMETNIAF